MTPPSLAPMDALYLRRGRKQSKAWSTSDWRELHDLGLVGAFSPDGSRIVTQPTFGTGAIVDAATGEEILTLKGHTDIISSLRFSPDGRYVVTAARDSSVRVWDARTAAETVRLAGHAHAWVMHASFSPDGKRILTYAKDNSVKLWDLEGNELVTLPTDEGGMSHAVWSPGGDRIATGHQDGSANIWESVPWKELEAIGDSETSFDEKLQRWRERRDRELQTPSNGRLSAP